MDAVEVSEKRGLGRCMACGACSRVCPSARNGGFVPDEFVWDLKEGRLAGDVWKCLQCYRCFRVCRVGIDVPAAVMDVRAGMSADGDAPAKFLAAAESAERTGSPFARSPRVSKQRKELGLADWNPGGGSQ